MTEPFDQDLYDAVINEFPAYDHADPPDAYDVWEGAADIAAQIAAERQAAPDDALVGISIATIRKTIDYIRNDELKPGHVVRSRTTFRTCPADMDRIERALARIEAAIDAIQ